MGQLFCHLKGILLVDANDLLAGDKGSSYTPTAHGVCSTNVVGVHGSSRKGLEPRGDGKLGEEPFIKRSVDNESSVYVVFFPTSCSLS